MTEWTLKTLRGSHRDDIMAFVLWFQATWSCGRRWREGIVKEKRRIREREGGVRTGNSKEEGED